jgi:3-oxoacyl-[acyl-carrier-protein] synthase-3
MIRPVYINRISTVLPNAPVLNDQMEAVLGQAGPRPSRARLIVLRSNGIKSRHYVIDPNTGEPTHNNTQLTAEAVRGLAGKDFSLDEIGLLATGTSSPDQIAPSHAVMVHGELGNPPCETMAASGICVSGVNAMKFAWLAVASAEHASAVSTGSEVASTFMWARNFEPEREALVASLEQKPVIAFEKDFLRWMLSDAAAAALLQDKPNAAGLSLRVEGIDVFSYANRYPACMYVGAEANDSGHLKGWREFPSWREVTERSVFVLKQNVRLLEEGIPAVFHQGCLDMLSRRNLRADEIDWFLPHYSSEHFRDICFAAMPEHFKIPRSRWFTNLSRVGNVGAASFYLMLGDLFQSGELQPGQRLLCFVPESGRFSIAFVHLIVVGPTA